MGRDCGQVPAACVKGLAEGNDFCSRFFPSASWLSPATKPLPDPGPTQGRRRRAGGKRRPVQGSHWEVQASHAKAVAPGTRRAYVSVSRSHTRDWSQPQSCRSQGAGEHRQPAEQRASGLALVCKSLSLSAATPAPQQQQWRANGWPAPQRAVVVTVSGAHLQETPHAGASPVVTDCWAPSRCACLARVTLPSPFLRTPPRRLHGRREAGRARLGGATRRLHSPLHAQVGMILHTRCLL
jgi:hypothetical protein